MPALQPLLNLPPRSLQFLGLPILALRTSKRFPRLRLLEVSRCGCGFLLRINGHEHALHAAQIRHTVFGETTREEGARGVFAGEEVVGAAGPVRLRGNGKVVDCAV